MRDAGDDERRLGEREATLGIAATLARLSPHDTLSQHTLLASGAAPERDATADTGHALLTAGLPWISVDFGAARGRGGGPAGDAGQADLAVVRLLGEGGMGRVHLAVQRSLGREVAVKTLKEGASHALAEGLLREARITGALEHPGVIPVHALGRDEHGRPLLVMKRVEGTSLRDLLDAPDHPGWRAVSSDRSDRLAASLEVLIRVCQALAFGHSRGIVHRDVKPDNIMVGAYGEVYLLDWGLAVAADEAAAAGQALLGTPVYMAPEMALGEPIDARTDVYLLGATLHHVLTGTFRHRGETVHAVLLSVVASAPVVYPPDVPPELADLCNRATARDPAARPPDADAFRRELSDHLRRRGAMALCDAALARTAALEALLRAAPPGAVPEDIAAAYRLATEARFVFAQILRDEPTLEPARRGLERAILTLVDLELRQDHAATAAALLGELADPPPAWRARVDAAQAKEDRARREAARLQALDRDHDPRVSARSRNLGLVGLGGGLVVVTLLVDLLPGGATALDAPSLILVSVALLVVFSAAVLVLRRRLLDTAFNRSSVAVVWVGLAAMLVHRLFAVRHGHDVATVLADDLVIMTALLALAAFTVHRVLATAATVMLLGRIVAELRPEWTHHVFSAAAILSVLLVAWLFERRVAAAP